jgi:hypothetical protein
LFNLRAALIYSQRETATQQAGEKGGEPVAPKLTILNKYVMAGING